MNLPTTVSLGIKTKHLPPEAKLSDSKISKISFVDEPLLAALFELPFCELRLLLPAIFLDANGDHTKSRLVGDFSAHLGQTVRVNVAFIGCEEPPVDLVICH